MTTNDRQRFQENLQNEMDAVLLYRALARLEQDAGLKEVYGRMAAAEERHAELWRSKLREHGANADIRSASWRTRVLIWLAERFGPGLVLPTIVSQERQGHAAYASDPEAQAAGLAAEESSHARLFTAIGDGPGGMPGADIARFEGRHRATGGNALRAAVLGANDGLVSNLSLVMGVAGASLAGRSILITGMAGLLAGSLSMALGEWLSVQSARELYEHQISIERAELESAPADEAEELTLIYMAKGIKEEQARLMANQIVQNPGIALSTLAREELGIDPEELGGSAWVAAITSFALFSLGAIVPVAPYFVGGGTTAAATSIGLSIVALFLIGAAITLITGRNALISGLRQILFGITAAAITYGIGFLIGGGLG